MSTSTISTTAFYSPPHDLFEAVEGQVARFGIADGYSEESEVIHGVIEALNFDEMRVRIVGDDGRVFVREFCEVRTFEIELPAEEVEYLELCDDLDGCREALGEIEAQHRSETAAFGDSWPGAQIQIRDGRAHLAELEARFEAHPRTVADREASAAAIFERVAAEVEPF